MYDWSRQCIENCQLSTDLTVGLLKVRSVSIVTVDSEALQAQVTTSSYVDQFNLYQKTLKGIIKAGFRHIYGVRHAYKENIVRST